MNNCRRGSELNTPLICLWKKFKPNVFYYPKDVPSVHPIQKPVALLNTLIDTFSHPGDVVLNFTMGSGLTVVACVKTGRHFVGTEAHKAYFAVAEKRIRQAQSIRTKDEKARTNEWSPIAARAAFEAQSGTNDGIDRKWSRDSDSGAVNLF